MSGGRPILVEPDILDALERALAARSKDKIGRAAFFDLDGTLIKGHMIADLPPHLARAGLFGRPELVRIRRLMAGLRSGRVSYRTVAERLPAVYAAGVAGDEVAAVAAEAAAFAVRRRAAVFPYSRRLVGLMKRSGRLAIALSGSPLEAVSALSGWLGMDASFGTELEVREGRYDGRVRHNLIMLETKRRFLDALADALDLRLEECFGFGDTGQDRAFLDVVGRPVALNPDRRLRAIALNKGWPIFATGQDIIGKMRKMAGD